MAALIEVQNLKKYFETPRGTLHAVDDVSFKIEQATTMGVGLIGDVTSPFKRIRCFCLCILGEGIAESKAFV